MLNASVVHEFALAINHHDLHRLCTLMTEDHRFIDAHGDEVVGRDKMKAGWHGYFQMFPDYEIEITEIYEMKDTIAAFGFASGTYGGKNSNNHQNHWRIPAAWKAIVVDERVALWQVYADTKIPFDIIARNA